MRHFNRSQARTTPKHIPGHLRDMKRSTHVGQTDAKSKSIRINLLNIIGKIESRQFRTMTESPQSDTIEMSGQCYLPQVPATLKTLGTYISDRFRQTDPRELNTLVKSTIADPNHIVVAMSVLHHLRHMIWWFLPPNASPPPDDASC